MGARHIDSTTRSTVINLVKMGKTVPEVARITDVSESYIYHTLQKEEITPARRGKDEQIKLVKAPVTVRPINRIKGGICYVCGGERSDAFKFCPHCGAPVTNQYEQIIFAAEEIVQRANHIKCSQDVDEILGEAEGIEQSALGLCDFANKLLKATNYE